MKTKLLKRLRKRFIIQERNGIYRVFDKQVRLGGIYNQTDWIYKQDALSIRRQWILREASNYKIPKNTL